MSVGPSSTARAPPRGRRSGPSPRRCRGAAVRRRAACPTGRPAGPRSSEGPGHLVRSLVATHQRPSFSTRRPSSTRSPVISSAYSGWPSAASAIRARTAASTESSASRFATSVSALLGPSGSTRIDVAFSFPPAHPGDRPGARGGPCTRAGSGRPARSPRRVPTSSRNFGSAHCRSSIAKTSGRSAASCSSSIRIAQNVSSGAALASADPDRLPDAVPRPCRRSSPDQRAPRASSARPRACRPHADPRSSMSASASG